MEFTRNIPFGLKKYPRACWSFFFGLIIAASWYVAKDIPKWNANRVALLLLGIGLMIALFTSAPVSMPVTPISLIIGGAVAISAMLMPGISGSFVLVILGLYQPILMAINGLHLDTLMYFALGMGI